MTPKKKANRRRPRCNGEILRDRRRIANLYLKGWLQVDIAKELDLSQTTICRDLKALHKQWAKSAAQDFSQARAQELARIDRLEREYWAAWDRSCEDAETNVKKAVESGGQQRREAVQTLRGQAGDPRFLAGVQWCIEKRCKILGIDAPDKLQLSGDSERPVCVIGLDLDEL